MSEPIRQLVAVSAWNVRSMSSRLKSSTAAAVGFFGVVLVFVVILSIREGLVAVAKNTGSNSVAIVSNSSGLLDGSAIHIIGQMPGVAQDTTSGPLVAGTFEATAQITTRSSNLLGTVTLRGVGQNIMNISPKLRIIQGRMFKAGRDEIIVGRQAERLFRGLSVGDSFNWNHRDWKVVGIFAMGGGIYESELFTDVVQLQAAYNAANQYSNVYVRLTSPSAFQAFRIALERNPQLSVTAVRETAYFQQIAGPLSKILILVSAVITLLMAIGAIFGAINIMYSNVAKRMQDIATMRALGFARLPILIAVMLEGVVLGLVGGASAALIAYLIFNNYQASTNTNGAMMAFSFAVTPALIATALALSVFMGFIGGLFPAIRAARLPVATALRET